MKFRTEYKVAPSPLRLSPRKPLVMTGSCFAQNMAAKMRESMWNAHDCFGVLYNPLSIEQALRLTLAEAPEQILNSIKESELKIGRMHYSWMFDSKMGDEAESNYIENVQHAISEARELFKKGAPLVVTFGTSWVYELTDRPGYVVANCHKQPSSMFVRRRLGIEEIVRSWKYLARDLKGIYPQLEIVFTVSPVRHLKDGFEGNKISKAILLLAVEEICRELSYCHYFPAYEIVNDDLRDYRFYASDLVHPSDEAVEYLWDIFKATYLDDSGIVLLKEGEKLRKRLEHRPLYHGWKSELTLQEETHKEIEIAECYNQLLERWPEMLELTAIK